MACVRFYLVIFITLLPIGAIAQDDPPAEPTHFDNLLPLIAAESEMTTAEWKLLLAALPPYQSPAKGIDQVKESDFSAITVFCGVGKDTDADFPALAVAYLKRGDEVLELSLRDGLSPISLLTGTSLFLLVQEREQWWRLDDVPWRGFFDGRHLTAQSSFSTELTGGVSGIELNLPSWAANKLQSKSPRRSWLPSSRTLRLQADRGTVEFRFRTPEDALRYGTPIAAVRFDAVDSSEVVFVESLQYDRVVPLYSTAAPRWPADELAAKTFAVPDGSTLDLKLDQVLESKRMKQESRRMLMWLQEAARPAGSPTMPDSFEKWEELVSIAMETTDESQAKHFPGNQALAEAKAETLRSQLDALCDEISMKGERPTDDPAMIAWEVQAEISTMMTHRSFGGVALLLACNVLTDETEYALLDAVGDLGHPAFVGDGRFFSFFRKQPDPVADAILHSRWGWPCEQEQIDACVTALNTVEPGGRGERVLVETLIRADQTEQVPAEALRRWINAEILHADEPKRRRSAAVMTAVPSGRAAILASPDIAQAAVPIRAAVTGALRSRADATQQTRMWLFMSEEECRRATEWLQSMESRN